MNWIKKDRKMGQDTAGARKESFLSGGYGVSEKASSNKPAPCSLGFTHTISVPLTQAISLRVSRLFGGL